MAKEAHQETKEGVLNSSPESGSLDSNAFGATEPYDDEVKPQASFPRRALNSFKRDPNLRATPRGVITANGEAFDVEAAALNTADSPLARKLKGRHLQMIAIGGSIGTAFFSVPFRSVKADRCRYWSVCCIRKISVKWWSSVCPHRLQPYRNDALLYGSGPR